MIGLINIPTQPTMYSEPDDESKPRAKKVSIAKPVPKPHTKKRKVSTSEAEAQAQAEIEAQAEEEEEVQVGKAEVQSAPKKRRVAPKKEEDEEEDERLDEDEDEEAESEAEAEAEDDSCRKQKPKQASQAKPTKLPKPVKAAKQAKPAKQQVNQDSDDQVSEEDSPKPKRTTKKPEKRTDPKVERKRKPPAATAATNGRSRSSKTADAANLALSELLVKREGMIMAQIRKHINEQNRDILKYVAERQGQSYNQMFGTIDALKKVVKLTPEGYFIEQLKKFRSESGCTDPVDPVQAKKEFKEGLPANLREYCKQEAESVQISRQLQREEPYAQWGDKLCTHGQELFEAHIRSAESGV